MQGLIECLSAFIASIGFSFIFRIHHNFRFAICGIVNVYPVPGYRTVRSIPRLSHGNPIVR